ncbi:MAG: EAL domain-containing protein, partial [Proteobacteria bacterium]|nr:EAL domain-containing protein [Pseudomonadota bacterium]
PKSIKVTEEELEKAITQNELVVHYQPQIHLSSGKIVGLEALVRWQHPEHGLLLPDVFIPMAEQKKELIDLLTYSVLDNVLHNSTLKKIITSDLNVSINLSATMLHDLSLPDKVSKMLTEHDFDPDRLIVEITESGAMEDPALTMDILTRLRLKNIRLSIDDFGTGFSSLVQLYRMPFNEIKVDKSFVMKAMVDEEAATIVRTTIELGHGLGLEVVAEGIEGKETLDWLKELGCDIGQGYFISRPVDVDNLESWVKEYSKK